MTILLAQGWDELGVKNACGSMISKKFLSQEKFQVIPYLSGKGHYELISTQEIKNRSSRFADINGDGDYLDKSEASNYGSEIELCAPGGGDINLDRWPDDTNEWVYSTLWDNTYGKANRTVGTSMATPHVSGVAALVLSLNPKLSNSEIRSILRYTADDLGEKGKDEYYGYGKVNAYKAKPTIREVTKK